MAEFGDAFVKIGADTSKFDKAMQGVDAKLKGLTKNTGKKFSDVGKVLSVGLTAPIVTLGYSILNTAGKFEKAMNGVKAITQSTGKEFEALTNKALQLGKTTQFSATEAAKGLEVLARNGLSVSQILGGAADASLALAAATGTDLSNAADIATDAMLQFKFEASELSGVVDTITGATTNSKFGIDDMRLALSRGGAVAGSVGISFKDFATAIAATSSAFSSGQTSGTAFQSFLTQLNPKTDEARRLQEDLNLEFVDGEGNFKSMSEIAGQLQRAFTGLSDSQKTQYSETLFGNTAMQAALSLADTGSAKFDKLAESIDKVSASEQAKIRMEGFSGSMAQLKNAFEAVQLAIANSGLLDFAGKLVVMATDVIKVIASLNPKLLRIITIMGGLLAIVGPVALAIGSLIPIVSSLGIALLPLVAKILAVTAAIGVLILIVQSIYDAWTPIAQFFDRLFTQIQKNIVNAVFGIVDAVSGFLKTIGIDITDFKEGLRADVASLNEELALMPPTTFGDAVGAIGDSIADTFSTAKDTVDDLMNSVSGKGGLPTTETTNTEGNTQQGGGRDLLGADFTTPLETLDLQMQSVGETSNLVAEGVSGIFDNTTNAIQANNEALEENKEKLKGLVGEQFNLKASAEAAVAALGTQAKQLGQSAKGLKDFGKQLLNTAKQNVSAIIAEGVAAAVKNALVTVPFPANIAIAGIAGGAAAALFNSLIPSFANGAIVSGDTIAQVGEYAGAKNNPEIIAPLDKLQNIIGNTGGTQLSKEDLNDAFSKQRITVNSQIGMTEIVKENGRTQYVSRKGTFSV